MWNGTARERRCLMSCNQNFFRKMTYQAGRKENSDRSIAGPGTRDRSTGNATARRGCSDKQIAIYRSIACSRRAVLVHLIEQ